VPGRCSPLGSEPEAPLGTLGPPPRPVPWCALVLGPDSGDESAALSGETRQDIVAPRRDNDLKLGGHRPRGGGWLEFSNRIVNRNDVVVRLDDILAR